MKPNENQRSRSFFVHGLSKLSYFSQKTVGLFETEYHLKACESSSMNIYTNGVGHMTKKAATLIYSKIP